MDFVAIDFETANQARSSACAVGLAFVSGGKIVGKESYLIRPPMSEFSSICTNIHGITWTDVRNEPEFPEIWKLILPKIDGTLVVAHNSTFDVSVLKAALNHYRIEFPKIETACTLRISKKVWRGVKSYSLSDLCSYLGIRPGDHDAAEDARAAAELLLAAMATKGATSPEAFIDSVGVKRSILAGCEWEDAQPIPVEEIEQALNLMEGITRGILLDGKVNAEERRSLFAWYEGNREIADRYPIKEIVQAIDRAMDDDIIDKDEIQDISALAAKIKSDYFSIATADLQKLYGMMYGILSDHEVTKEELQGLNRWMDDIEHLMDCYPYSLVHDLVASVLKDGRMDDSEKAAAEKLFRSLLQESGQAAPPDAPVRKLSWHCGSIIFEDSSFVITGESCLGSRTKITKIIEAKGGKVSSIVSKKTDYVVVGGAGNPHWAFSSAGTKIMAAMELQGKGAKVKFVKDKDVFC